MEINLCKADGGALQHRLVLELNHRKIENL